METAIRQRAPKTGVKRRRLKNGILSYGIDYIDAGGRRIREWGFPDAMSAKAARADRTLKARAGKLGVRPSKQSFREYADNWHTMQKPRLKPSTYRLYGGYLRTHLLPAFGDYVLQGLTTFDVKRFQNDLAKTDVSPKTVNNVLVLLKTILKSAEEDGQIESNPATPVKRLKWRRPEMSFLTTAQVAKFLETARACTLLEIPAKRCEFFTVAFTTGMRLGELLGLQWGDIDFDAGFIHGRWSLYQSEYVDPKSEHSIRKVMLIPEAREALLSLRERESGERDAPVFWDSPRTDKVVRRVLDRILDEAGLPTIRLHDMRHTYASILISLGLNPKFIQKQMGHSSIQITFDLYGHLFPEAYEDAAIKLQTALFGTDRPLIGPRTETVPGETAKGRVQSSELVPAVP